MSRKLLAIVSAIALATLAVQGVAAQTQSIQRFQVSDTYEQTIARFPDALQSGFEAMWTALKAMNQDDGKALEVLHSYIALNFVRTNIMEAGIVEIPFPNQDVTYADFYPEYRAQMLANAVHILPAIIVMGNPFGTDWNAWFDALEAYL
jgi:hypothetical protein